MRLIFQGFQRFGISTYSCGPGPFRISILALKRFLHDSFGANQYARMVTHWGLRGRCLHLPKAGQMVYGVYAEGCRECNTLNPKILIKPKALNH